MIRGFILAAVAGTVFWVGTQPVYEKSAGISNLAIKGENVSSLKRSLLASQGYASHEDEGLFARNTRTNITTRNTIASNSRTNITTRNTITNNSRTNITTRNIITNNSRTNITTRNIVTNNIRTAITTRNTVTSASWDGDEFRELVPSDDVFAASRSELIRAIADFFAIDPQNTWNELPQPTELETDHVAS